MAIVCTICKKSEFLTLRDDLLKMYYCTPCNHEFTVIKENQNTIYSEDYYTQQHANWFNNPNYWLFEFIYSNIVKLLKKDEFKLLDVGCGKGDLLKFIKDHNSKIKLFGIDISGNYHPGIEFIRGDFLEEEINIKFDAICSLATIEHVFDVDTLVKKMEDLLLPEGFLVLMTVNANGILYEVAKILKKVGINKPFYRLYDLHHVNHFTGYSLRKLMENKGFDIIVQKKHNYSVRAVDLPKANFIMKIIYTLGVRIFFSLPGRFGILQTVICKRKKR